MSDKKPAYYFDTEAEMDEYWGKVLLGPEGWDCLLGEPEDCTWYRDGSTAMNKLNEQHEEIQRLRQLLNDNGIDSDAFKAEN